MDNTTEHEKAAALWVEYGWTSARNPVLESTYDALIQPLGITCEYLECDTTPGLMRLPTFVSPKINLSMTNRSLAALLPSERLFPYLDVTIKPDGSVIAALRQPVPEALIADLDAFGEGNRLAQILQKARLTFSKIVEAVFVKTCLPTSIQADSALFVRDTRGFMLQFFGSLTTRTQ